MNLVTKAPGLETVLWTTSDGVRCVLARYDETRYQLRLMRSQGTVKADLFTEYDAALTAAQEWRRKVVIVARDG